MGAPDAEYAFEVEVREFRDFEKLLRAEGKLLGPPVRPIYKGFFAANGMDQYNLSKVSLLLPRLSVGSPSEFANLVSTVGVDLYDALGIRQVTPPRLEVNF
jgi:hypothetical protein